MRSRTSDKNVSSLYGLGIAVAALTTFTIGYTVSRVGLNQSSNQNVAAEDYNFVVPHQAVMWQDFDGQF